VVEGRPQRAPTRQHSNGERVLAVLLGIISLLLAGVLHY
jgi:hypothetical protein